MPLLLAIPAPFSMLIFKSIGERINLAV